MSGYKTPERILSDNTIEGPSGCTLWVGAFDRDGYGVVNRAAKTSAHRFAWTLINGPVPDGLELDHLCRVRNCVNAAHLEAVTHAENMRRAVGRVPSTPIVVPFALRSPSANSQKTHCVNGHEFTPENTRMSRRTRGDVDRVCRTCTRARDRARYARRKAA